MSSASESFYRWQGQSLTLFCHLQPGASSSAFAGQHGDRLKIRIAAPAVDGKANRALIDWLATEFALPRAAISIERGERGRRKTVCLRAPQRLPAQLGIAQP